MPILRRSTVVRTFVSVLTLILRPVILLLAAVTYLTHRFAFVIVKCSKRLSSSLPSVKVCSNYDQVQMAILRANE